MIPKNVKACIYPKDIQRIMGKGYLQSRLYLLKIKQHYNKAPEQFISIEEFSEYTGLKEEHIVRCIVEWKKVLLKVCSIPEHWYN